MIAKPNYAFSQESIQNAFTIPYNELAIYIKKRVEEFFKLPIQDGVIDTRELSIRISRKFASLYVLWMKKEYLTSLSGEKEQNVSAGLVRWGTILDSRVIITWFQHKVSAG